MSGILRTLARSKAKDNMKRQGLSKICKGDFFAKNWRKFVKSKEAEHGRKSKARTKSA